MKFIKGRRADLEENLWHKLKCNLNYQTVCNLCCKLYYPVYPDPAHQSVECPLHTNRKFLTFKLLLDDIPTASPS